MLDDLERNAGGILEASRRSSGATPEEYLRNSKGILKEYFRNSKGIVTFGEGVAECSIKSIFENLKNAGAGYHRGTGMRTGYYLRDCEWEPHKAFCGSHRRHYL